jgi:hypothetical protein
MNKWKIILWIFLIIITAVNITSASINKNPDAIRGWIAAECWLLILLGKEMNA